MGSAASLLALPDGVDPDSGVSMQVPFVSDGGTIAKFNATVPGNAVWVVETVQIACDTGATAGNRTWLLDLLDPSLADIALVAGPAAFGNSISCFLTWGLGMAASSAPDSNANIWQSQGLPAMPLWGGCTVRAELRGSFGGDKVPGAFTGAPTCVVTQFDLGAGGGGTAPAQLGPWMLVASPIADATVAA